VARAQATGEIDEVFVDPAVAIVVDAVADLRCPRVNSDVAIVAVPAFQPCLVACAVAGGVSVPVVVGAGDLSLRRRFECDERR
jgi:hypothetical protein